MDEKMLKERLDAIARRRTLVGRNGGRGSTPKELQDVEPAYAATNAMYPGATLTQDEMEFGRAMERRKREKREPLDCRDVMEITISLGYRKTQQEG